MSAAVPFSWELCPGIPKPTCNLASRPTHSLLLLPLPPPLRSTSSTFPKRRSRSGSELGIAADPFAAALAECAKDPPPPSPSEMEEIWRRSSEAAPPPGRRRAISDRLGGIGSCKATCSVVESTVYLPRSEIRTGGYGLLSSRIA
ncbi:uncharacterized protein [Typha angustifolia]|uniref:uncharacterized protein n=1 Tax=Typha angustifolia TaxID=59011 RepID=UPI003C2E1B04